MLLESRDLKGLFGTSLSKKHSKYLPEKIAIGDLHSASICIFTRSSIVSALSMTVKIDQRRWISVQERSVGSVELKVNSLKRKCESAKAEIVASVKTSSSAPSCTSFSSFCSFIALVNKYFSWKMNVSVYLVVLPCSQLKRCLLFFSSDEKFFFEYCISNVVPYFLHSDQGSLLTQLRISLNNTCSTVWSYQKLGSERNPHSTTQGEWDLK